MKKKALTLPVAAVALVGVLSGCASGTADPGATGDSTVVMSFWSSGEADDAVWQTVADMVTEQYPEITVDLQTAGWNDYWTKLSTSLTGSNAPCIAGMQMGRLAQFSNLFTPLDDLLEPAGIDTAEFNSAIVETLQVDGAQMALPYDLGPNVIFYNKTAFESAGVDEPALGWTIDDFVETASALTTADTYGYALDNGIDAVSGYALTIAGVQAVNEAGELDVTNPGFEEALDFYAGLQTDEKVAAPLAADASSSAGALFLAGKAAMYAAGPWDMIYVDQTAEFEVGLASFPTGDAGAANLVSGSGFGISQKCENKDAAAKALSVITGAEALAYLGEQGRAFPARTDQAAAWYENAVPGAQEVIENALENAQPYRSTPTWTQVGLTWTDGVTSVINGSTEPSAFLQNVQASGQ